MTRTALRRISWPVVFGALAAPFLINCGALPKLPGVPGLAGCPDMTKIEEIDKFDFQGSFKLQAPVAAKLKAGLGAAVGMKLLADKVDADLTAACSGITADLGDATAYKNAADACGAAGKALGAAKAKLGAGASIKLDVTEPHCGLDMGAFSSCGASCDASFKPGSAEMECDGGKIEGTCGAQCSGDCELSAAAACSGECSGTCDAQISGDCSGKCDGKCDGKASNGASCGGKCEGKCSGNVKGTCKGKCGGSCHLAAAASCQGSCTGTCSAKMEAPKCTGSVKPPSMSADCKAKCDVQVQSLAKCDPPHVLVKIVGAADAVAAAKLQATIEKNFPVVVNVAIGLAKKVPTMVANVKAVVEGVQGVVQTATSDKIAGAQLVACVASPFKGAIDAAAGVTASVNVSVSVNASVSGSASGSASGKAGG
jgi:hypothetical protein